MGNRGVIRNLEKAGDHLEAKRIVDHYIYFKDEVSANKFIEEVKKKGFKLNKLNYDKSLGERPFSVWMTRMDAVTYDAVDDYVLYLWELAPNYDGKYDGWESIIVK